jgi:TolB-like protein
MLPRTKLGPYEIIEAIGHGGMGEVYRARDPRLQRQVAIKTVASHVVADPQFRERFDREARAVAALSHPNVLAIYDVGSHEDIPYIAVELLEGETLRARTATAPLPVSTVLEYAVQVGRGLAAAHERGIVHRDLKPENIFVTRGGQIKLLDFGLATEPVHESGDEATRAPQTECGALLGTAGYMSPEQARGERTDARTDIFSFGCVLYEMVSARRAFSGDSRIETLNAILKEHPADLSSLRGDVPPQLDRIVRRCLEKAPENRFQTAHDLVFALETLSHNAGHGPSAGSSPVRSRAVSTRVAAAIVATVVVAAATAVWWTVMRGRSASESAPDPVPSAEAPRVLAVLPFTNISRGGEGHFAAGMTEEVTGQLSKLSGLRVISRAAVAAYKDARTDLPRMVQELGIGSVVTGTVREEGARVRVNVELIDATSGQVIWSDQSDHEGVDVFAAQSSIALRVASALNASVTLDERARLGKAPTSSVAAYELLMRARNPPGKTTEERLAAAIDLLQQAIALDPRFATAYAQIAFRSYNQGAYGNLPALARGLEAAHKAIEIDPQLAVAYHALALNLQQMGRLQEALPEYRKGVELSPSAVNTLNDFSMGLATAGRCDESLTFSKRSLALAPNVGSTPYNVGIALLCLDDDARTERFLTPAATRFPNAHRLQVLLALLDLRRGRSEAAVQRIRAATDKSPGNIELQLARAEILTFAGVADAPDIVRALFSRAADGMFHTAPYPLKLAHAYHLQRGGSTAEAGKILDTVLAANRQALIGGADWPMAFMQIAAVHALRGEMTPALDELDHAYAAGWRDGRTLAIDPLLAPVRSEPRFKALLARIEADVTAMRARADYSALP